VRRRPVVLLVAEAVTLAHYARIIAMARALDPSDYDVVVASDSRFASIGPTATCRKYELKSIPSSAFTEALARGRPVYDADTLAAYVDNDLALFARVKPDLVIGDFRLSLAVSAPASRVRYAAVANAYWSPYAAIEFPVPDLPMTRVLGVPLAQKVFNVARSAAFALHSRPLDRIRRRHNLPPLGGDLRTAYTWGDYTLYADVPDYVPMRTLPVNHRYIGPLMWSTRPDMPDWWDHLPPEAPLVLVTLGTTGTATLLPAILASLAPQPAIIVVATATDIRLSDVPANARVARYLPLDVVAPRCKLVVCNGGSLTTYGAFVSNAPVLGLCTNMDQLLNMQAVSRFGAGLALRAGALAPHDLQDCVGRLLGTLDYAKHASDVGKRVTEFDPPRRLRDFVAEVLA
jgi:UDP:flavonoid glycosyltransferase YjiC (YdhE family)